MIKFSCIIAIEFLVCLLAAVAPAADWGVSRAVPPFDAFWEARPKGDVNTLILWPFDDEASGMEDVLDQLEDITTPPADVSSTG